MHIYTYIGVYICSAKGSEVTQDHRVAGWARAMRAERLCLKVGERLGVDQDTRSLILELEKRLANAERCGFQLISLRNGHFLRGLIA